MKINPLVFCPSPRDIPQWLDAMKKLDFVDKLYVKYTTPEKTAYDIGRNYFLDNKQYTHLVILPDDLIVTPEQLKSLMESVEKHDYIVFSGVANLDLTTGKDLFSVSFDYVNIDRRVRRITLMSRLDLDQYALEGKHIKVGWSGFPCMFFKRSIIEKFEFNSDGVWNDVDGFTGCCVDTVFCWWCYENNIPIWIDPCVRMLHLKISDYQREYFYAGDPNHPPKTYLEKKIK